MVKNEMELDRSKQLEIQYYHFHSIDMLQNELYNDVYLMWSTINQIEFMFLFKIVKCWCKMNFMMIENCFFIIDDNDE